MMLKDKGKIRSVCRPPLLVFRTLCILKSCQDAVLHYFVFFLKYRKSVNVVAIVILAVLDVHDS